MQDQDEWKDFEEEKKDYSGLKIGNLQVTESADAESDDGRGTGENSSDGESGEPGTKHSGPWKKTAQPEAQSEVEPAQNQEVQKPQPVTTGSSYKPPHLRNQSSVAASPRNRMKNIAPDINSEEYFPTLSSKQQQGNEPTGPWGRRYVIFFVLVVNN